MTKRIFFLVGVIFAFVPFTASAAGDASALLGGSGGGLVSQCVGAFCRACDLMELANNVINFGVAFSVIIATLMFAYAGILYVTAASAGPEQVKKAHGVFVNVFVGLLLVLLAWLIVNITFSVLSGRGLEFWTQIRCVDNPTSDAFSHVDDRGVGGVVVGAGTAAGTPATSATPTTGLPGAEAVRRLQAAGVCGGATGTRCPAASVLEGVKSSTIDQAIILHNACGCPLQINSGTNGSHRPGEFSHGNGYKLDIQYSNNPTLERFVRSLEFRGRVSDWDGAGPGTYPADIYLDGCGNKYAMEPTILDLQVRTLCTY